MKRTSIRIPKRHLDPIGNRIRLDLLNCGAKRPLPVIQDPQALDCLVRQLIDSIRRVEFAKRLATVRYKDSVADPSRESFDPLKAAVLRVRQGNSADAAWLIFLATHFGKHGRDGWALVRAVYGGAGGPQPWDWNNVSAQTPAFLDWLDHQKPALRLHRFGNHRKYESLDAFSLAGTGTAVTSFIDWVRQEGSLDGLVKSIHRRVGQNPAEVFDALYRDMQKVRRFGRLAKFDFLTMLGKLGVAPIVPGSAYVWDNATGPYAGMRLLITGDRNGKLTRSKADAYYEEFGNCLMLGMQELEDALCNWQKSPKQYKLFRG
jgi:hypothetical protein